MIGYLNGIVQAGGLVVVGGVGYQVETAQALTAGEPVEVWIHTAVRENDISLYGFVSIAERELFLALTKVTGVGPKLAMSMLSLGAATVVGALRDGDVKALAKAPGLGAKRAEHLCAAVKLPVELLEALDALEGAPDPTAGLVGALTGLGFPETQARATVTDLLAQGFDLQDESGLMMAAVRSLRAA